MSGLRGFGVVGIIVAVEVLAILVHVSLPMVREHQMRQHAAQVVREFSLVRTAALAAKAHGGEWPNDGRPGTVPPSLAPYLPPGFSFERNGYKLDWDQWPLSDGMSDFAAEGQFAAASVITDDTRLASAVVQLLGAEQPHFTIGNRSTFVISEPFAPAE